MAVGPDLTVYGVLSGIAVGNVWGGLCSTGAYGGLDGIPGVLRYSG